MSDKAEKPIQLFRPAFAIVGAIRIDAIFLLADGAELLPAQAGQPPMRVSRDFLARFNPRLPGYLVRLPDGSGVWCNADFFECCFDPQ